MIPSRISVSCRTAACYRRESNPFRFFNSWRDVEQISALRSLAPERTKLASSMSFSRAREGRYSAPYQGSFILWSRLSIEGDTSVDPIWSTPIGTLRHTFAQSEPLQLVASNWHKLHQTT